MSDKSKIQILCLKIVPSIKKSFVEEFRCLPTFIPLQEWGFIILIYNTHKTLDI